MKILKFVLISILIAFAAINCSAQKTENFKTFWKSFVADSVFQKERTQFPLTYMYYQYGEIEEEHDDLITEKITADDWWFLILEDQYSKNKFKKDRRTITIERNQYECKRLLAKTTC